MELVLLLIFLWVLGTELRLSGFVLQALSWQSRGTITVCDLTLPNLHPNHRSEGKAQHISFVEYNFCGWVMLSPLCSEKILTRNSKRKALEVFLSKRARCVESPSYLADQVLHVFSVLQGCGLVSSMVMGPLFSGQLNIEILGNKRAGRSQRHNFTCPLNFESLFLCVCVWLLEVVVGVCVCEFVSLYVSFEKTHPQTSCLTVLLLGMVQCKAM